MSAKKAAAKSPAAGVAGSGAEHPRFFATPAAWRAWLEKHHERVPVLWVGFHRVGSGEPSITWPESVDEALCFGWIDGLRKSLDATSYVIRFTPRKTSSNWSAVNVKRIAELEREGRVRPAGRRAYEARAEKRTGIYSYEQRPTALPAELTAVLRRNRAAWAWWSTAAPSYRKAATWWILTAKQDATRARRMAQLAECCAAGERIAPLRLQLSPHVGAKAATTAKSAKPSRATSAARRKRP